MTQYRTLNPLGSMAPKDLFDNAQNIDNWSNGDEPFYEDRFGILRRSFSGMNFEFDAAQTGRQEAFDRFLTESGFTFVGNYSADLVFDSRSDYMIRDDYAYRLADGATIPYTTTGNWAAEVDNFQLFSQDDVLRQDLANTTDANSGAAQIGRASVSVASIAALLTAKQAADLQYEVRGYHAGTNYGGGAFYWDAARPKAEHDGGMIVDPARAFPASWSDAAQIATWYTPATSGSGCWVRIGDDYYPDHFGATYTIGQNQTPMIQQAENSAAKKNKPLRLRNQYHELQTQFQVRRAPQIIGDSGGVGSLRSGKLVAGRKLSGAVLVSKVAGALAVDVRPATYDFGGQIENLTLLGRYDTVEAKVAGDGIKLDEFGWSATVKNLTVEDFEGIGVEIGYLQDTTFDRLTVLGCGPTYAKSALVFSKNSNYIYFRDPHIEDGNYLMRSYASDANGAAWEIHWSGAHFEVGNYSGTPDPTLEHRYETPCVRFEGQHRQWTFDTCTFVPVGSSFLAEANGGTADNQPYFMLADDASGFKFPECSFLSPTTGIDAVNIASTAAWADVFGPNEFLSCTFRGLNPTKTTSPVKVDIGNIVGGTVHFYTGGDSAILNGVQVTVGQIRGVTFASSEDTTTKTGGRLIYCPAAGGLTVGENTYRLSRDPFIWLSKECVLTDGRSLAIKDLAVNTALNMELEKPGTTYQASAAITITDITNCQRGRRVRVFNTSGGTLTVAQTATLYPNGAGALTMAHLLALELVSDSNGVLMKV